MILNFRTLGKGEPLIILHGVFGSSDNWQSQAKAFAEKYKVYLVDLRNHGNSFHSDAFDYQVMSEDVVALMTSESIEKAYVLGHSMGGKAAMFLASKYPDLVAQLIVVDIAPKHYLPHHQQIFEGFHSVNLSTLQSRKDADTQMSQMIKDFGVRQFILKNLHRDKEGKFSWKINLEAIEANIENVGVGLPKGYGYGGPVLFVGGSKSSYIQPEDEADIKARFPDSNVVTVEGAGHWVHAEKPAALIAHVLDFLP
ncbi:MAG: alpha/beta fold hydrolase [Cytophagales bacterium]|nr:alpha/beta fold hydrolase [Cytophagales bacterium]